MSGGLAQNPIFIMPAATRRARRTRESEEERAERRIYRTRVDGFIAELRLDYRDQLALKGQDIMISHHRSRVLKMRQFSGDPIIEDQVATFQEALLIDAHRIIGVFVNNVTRG